MSLQGQLAGRYVPQKYYSITKSRNNSLMRKNAEIDA